jgi:hypothetical protein
MSAAPNSAALPINGKVVLRLPKIDDNDDPERAKQAIREENDRRKSTRRQHCAELRCELSPRHFDARGFLSNRARITESRASLSTLR